MLISEGTQRDQQEAFMAEHRDFLADESTQAAGAEEPKVAQSCAACGHMRGALESEKSCGGCGADPATWLTAEVTPGPVDGAEAAVGEGLPGTEVEQTPNEPQAPFATAPPGTEGYDVNPELRVRY
jgi:hypothetical protein